MRLAIDFAPNMARVEDPQPTVIETDSTGLDFGAGWPGVLGEGYSQPSLEGPAGVNAGLIPAGILNDDERDGAIMPSAVQAPTSSGWTANPEYLGTPGRIDRLATDLLGPAHVGTVESFRVDGRRVDPGRPDLIYGGPVGTGDDVGQFLAVAMAQSTYDFPAQDLSQLDVLSHL